MKKHDEIKCTMFRVSLSKKAMQKLTLQIYIFSALPVVSTYFIFIHLCFYWMLFNSPKYKNIPLEILRPPFRIHMEMEKVVYVKTAHNYHIYVCAQTVEKNHEPWVRTQFSEWYSDIINAFTFYMSEWSFKLSCWKQMWRSGQKFLANQFNEVISTELGFMIFWRQY